MSEFIFLDKKNVPTNKDLLKSCGQYIQRVVQEIEKITSKSEWKFYSKKSGWTKKYLYNSKTLCFLQPYNNQIEAIFTISSEDEKKILETNNFSQKIKEKIKGLKQYTEGKSFRFFIESEDDLLLFKNFLSLKSGMDFT